MTSSKGTQNWLTTLAILWAVASGSGCQILVRVDGDQVPLPALRDSSVTDSPAPDRNDAVDAAADDAVDATVDTGTDLDDLDGAPADTQADN